MGGVKSGVSETKTLMASLTASMKQVGLGFATALNSGNAPLQKLRDNIAALGKTYQKSFLGAPTNVEAAFKPQVDAINKLRAASEAYQKHLAGRSAAMTIRQDPFGMTLQEQTRVWKAKQTGYKLTLGQLEKFAPTQKIDPASLSAMLKEASILDKLKDSGAAYMAAQARQKVMERGTASIEATQKTGGQSMQVLQNLKAARDEAIRVRAEYAKLQTQHISDGTLKAQEAKQNIANLTAEVNRLTNALGAAQNQFKDLGRNAAAAKWAANPPPVIPVSWLANMRARYQANAGASGGMNSMLPMMAGYFGGGRMGGLGGAVGGMFGMAGIGAAVGIAIGAIMAGLHKLFDFFKNGILEITGFAQRSRNLQAQTGISPKGGMVLERAAEMGGMDTKAMEQWISRFQANLSVVDKTAPKVSNSLAMMGLSLQQLRTMDPSDALLLLGSRIKTIGNISDQSGIQVALMNRQGATFLRIMRDMTLLKIAKEQIGSQAEFWNHKDQQGNYDNRDKLAYIADVFSGWTVKLRGFFAGLMEGMGDDLMRLAHWFNQLDLKDIGNRIGSVLKSINFEGIGITLMAVVRPAMELFIGQLETLADALELTSVAMLEIDKLGAMLGFATKSEKEQLKHRTIMAYGTDEEKQKERKRVLKSLDIAHPDLTGTSSQLGPLKSFFAPFGKGPGDQWSKIGAFSAPGMMQQFGTGIHGYHDKVLERLTGIYMNTKNMGAHLLNGRTMGQFGVNASSFPGAMVNAMTMPGMMVNGQSMTGFGAKALQGATNDEIFGDRKSIPGGLTPALNDLSAGRMEKAPSLLQMPPLSGLSRNLPPVGGMDNSAIFKAIERNTRDSGGNVTTVSSPSGLWHPAY